MKLRTIIASVVLLFLYYMGIKETIDALNTANQKITEPLIASTEKEIVNVTNFIKNVLENVKLKAICQLPIPLILKSIPVVVSSTA